MAPIRGLPLDLPLDLPSVQPPIGFSWRWCLPRIRYVAIYTEYAIYGVRYLYASPQEDWSPL